MKLTEAERDLVENGVPATRASTKRGKNQAVAATPEQSSDMGDRLHNAQVQLQMADIEAAHKVSDAAVARIKKGAAGLTAFKLVEQSSDITRDGVDMYSHFLDGMPSTDTDGLATLMQEATLEQNFLAMALSTPRQLTGS